MFLEAALSGLYIAIFLLVIAKHPFYRDDFLKRTHLQLLFLLKLAAGFMLFLIYTMYYPDRKYADIFRYYDDSSVILKSIFSAPFDFFRMMTGYRSKEDDLWTYYNEMNNWFNSTLILNDARTMIKLNVLFRLLAAGTYYPVTIIFCFLAFTGLTAIYKVAIKQLKDREGILAIGIYCMPSVMLWTSGIIKEAFLVFALGLTVYFVQRIAEAPKPVLYLYLLLSAFMLLNIKTYVFLVVFPGLLVFYRMHKKPDFGLLKFSMVHLLYIICIFYASLIFTHTTVPQHLQAKQLEFLKLADREQAGSAVPVPRLDGTFNDLLLNAPFAFYLSFARPTLLEADNIMMLLSALENTALLLLLMLNLYWIFSKQFNTEAKSVLLLSLFFVLITFCLIGWVTPILGAIVRYKVPALPFLMILLFSSNKWKGRGIKLPGFKAQS